MPSKEQQRLFHEQYRSAECVPDVVPEDFRREVLSPCYTTGRDKYSDNNMSFIRFVQERGGWEGKSVLDYGCGTGMWGMYLAQTGAASVVGIDIAETGIRLGRERAERQGLAHKVDLRVMDCCHMDFPDNNWDMVIGPAVLHHVLHFDNVFEELYRVLKPGATAYFRENLADFFLWRLYWRLRGEVESGDVPVFADVVRRKAHMFSGVEIVGETFVHSAKFLLWRRDPGFVRRSLLRTTAAIDDGLFSVFPPLRRWGSFCCIALTK